MMLKALLLSVLLLTTVTLMANPLSVSLRTGMILPDKNLDNGIITGMTIGYEVTPSWEAQISFDFHYQNSTIMRKIVQIESPYERRDELSDVEATFIPLSLNLQYNMPLTPRITPIFGAGLGVSFLMEEVTPKDKEYEEGFDTFSSYNGFNAVGWTGLKYELNPRINLLSQLLYRYNDLKGTTDLKTFGHIENRQDISGLGMNLGLEYNF